MNEKESPKRKRGNIKGTPESPFGRATNGGYKNGISKPAPEEGKLAEGNIESVCRHHWLIESPNGATSLGKCKECGVEKKFKNAAPDPLLDR